MALEPVYFELSWAILSTVGLANTLLGLMVIGIIGLSPISLVPLVVSIAGAIANGLCYYAFYGEYPMVNTIVASVFADLAWLIQEAGLSFYSYLILARVLRNRSRTVFLSAFWTTTVVVCAMRIAILIERVRFIIGEQNPQPQVELQQLINNFHVGYFVSIAVLEIISAVFLLRTFNAAEKVSMKMALSGGLFKYLIRSTEVRLAFLAVIGTTRAVTYSFQQAAQSATSVASQLDRFAYTLECLFPMVMYIDMLASRLVFSNDNGSSLTGQSRQLGRSAPNAPHSRFSQNDHAEIALYSVARHERHVEVQGGAGGREGMDGRESRQRGRTSSQEYIMDEAKAAGKVTASEFEFDNISQGGSGGGFPGGISKTVEFEVHTTKADRIM